MRSFALGTVATTRGLLFASHGLLPRTQPSTGVLWIRKLRDLTRSFGQRSHRRVHCRSTCI